jgi:hypothetical protein
LYFSKRDVVKEFFRSDQIMAKVPLIRRNSSTAEK